MGTVQTREFVVEGPVIKVGDNIDTDVIIPARYLVYTDPSMLAKHAMEPLIPNFLEKASKGVILVAGRGFGMGSSREQAAMALKAAGVKAVLAESFARIFYRNAINNGLPVLVVPGVSKEVNEGDFVRINVSTGEVLVNNGQKVLRARPITGMALEILISGGLLEYVKSRETLNQG
ncbi:3-isopropylmalate dehydratase small subunit [Vulcanisaeta souniana]|uniref:3-isopropylmalate dehydratase small subunit n=1 Tax=Vulcanisaeta souniana JCM 11219 TaxID=1293586 RepID=A0A830E709_9CREN|nr:3-isopropylmalate dehydratase small subunit [Vulcanisaeta souniana]BDR92513.1 3-isopropylmalate dehydratase small subunit [Vulcanisaeta souniana JCM 11219]GGI76098.1 3-isopropylmalate dehydratase small subunit [Vulcanisaeta souniana JCM 11219]